MAEVGQVDAPAAMVEATAINTRNMWEAVELTFFAFGTSGCECSRPWTASWLGKQQPGT